MKKSLLVPVAVLATLFTVTACDLDESTDGTKNNAPRVVKEGAQVTIGKYTVQKGWNITNDGIGGFTVKGVKVKNTSDEADTVFFTLKVLKGDEVLASIDCNTSEIEPGQQQAGNCFDTGSGKFKRGWDKITMESTF